MDRKIKVALCLSGEPRSSMASFPYIYESFLTDNPIYETDVYLHSVKGFRALDIYQPKNYLIERINISQYKQYFKDKLYNIIEELPELEFAYNYNTYADTLVNQLQMFSSIKKSFDLIKTSYDIYIRSRYDIMFKSKFSLPHILFEILDSKYDTFIPHQYEYKTLKNEYNDQIAVCNYKSMKIYSSLISNISDIIKQTKSLNSQEWLKYWLDINNIKTQQQFLDWGLIRQSNITTSNIYCNNFLDE